MPECADIIISEEYAEVEKVIVTIENENSKYME